MKLTCKEKYIKISKCNHAKIANLFYLQLLFYIQKVLIHFKVSSRKSLLIWNNILMCYK